MPFMQSQRRFEYEHIVTSNPWSTHDVVWAEFIREFMSSPRRPKRWQKLYFAKVQRKAEHIRRRYEETGEIYYPEFVTPETVAHIDWQLISIVLCAGMSQKQLFTTLYLIYPAPESAWGYN